MLGDPIIKEASLGPRDNLPTTPTSLALLPYDLAYSVSFDRYSARTDGKEQIAAAIRDIARTFGYSVLIDLGAGDGRLTRLVSPAFQETFAIEKNASFETILSSIPKVTPVINSMENVIPPKHFDLALMSYSLSGINESNLKGFLEILFRHMNPGGKLCYVTYQDGCAWDIFAGTVYDALGIPRTGGTSKHIADLARSGFTSQPIKTFHTAIWADSPEDLYHTLGFFFIKKIAEYERRIDQFLPILQDLRVNLPNGRVAMPVTEIIAEISSR